MSPLRIRRSQIVSTYGPGALVDLPDTAVLVAGLDHWAGASEAPLVPEPRLLANLRRRLKLPFLELRAPPVPEPGREDEMGIGVVVWQFPEWSVAQYEESTKEFGRSRPLLHRRALVKGRYQADDPTGKRKRKDWPVVPIRFVQACPNGHVSDIDWPRLVHGPGVACGGQLWMDERGTTGDLAELFLRCDGCKSKPLSLVRLQSTTEERSVLGECEGKRPWLGPMAQEVCTGPNGKPHLNKLLIRHASNAYFPVVERAISIPDHDERLRAAVDAVWDDFLSVAESEGDVKRERKKQRVSQALEGVTDGEVWAECQRRHSGTPEPYKSLKDVELDTFLSSPSELGDDKPDGDFHARRLPLPAHRTGALAAIERVVLVHRLREVLAEFGFTRFEAPGMPIESEVDLGVRLASLAIETRWLPAVENRGEGVFLSLDPKRVQDWLARPAVRRRAVEFQPGVQSLSKNSIPIERVEQIYMPYLMLHSLSHLVLTAIALECGYAAASIRERIYVRSGAYAILLYTGTPDAEGTLGGLVQVGRKIEHHLETALELGRLCSNDPVCAQHRPTQPHEGRSMHGAACHGCLLIAEPSCERRNELLDRSLVVPTVDQADAAFFGGSDVTGPLPILSAAALGALAMAAERGSLIAPFGSMQIGRHVGRAEQEASLRLIEALHEAGLAGGGLAVALRLAEAARRDAEDQPLPALVWSDLDVAGSRDTTVVCSELFRCAERDVLLSTFNLGHKAKDGASPGNPVLQPLAVRMSEVPALTVRLFLNLRRMPYMAHATEREVEDAFVGWFRKEVWPWERVPEVYYDPRSLEAAGDDTACLHAKCVVVDDARAFVTSANLTEAAHGRNIEAGVLLEDRVFARALRTQFESLIDRGYVRRLNPALVP